MSKPEILSICNAVDLTANGVLANPGREHRSAVKSFGDHLDPTQRTYHCFPAQILITHRPSSKAQKLKSSKAQEAQTITVGKTVEDLWFRHNPVQVVGSCMVDANTNS